MNRLCNTAFEHTKVITICNKLFHDNFVFIQNGDLQNEFLANFQKYIENVTILNGDGGIRRYCE